jgi:cytochrome bd-type quinol oxidase subunit 2
MEMRSAFSFPRWQTWLAVVVMVALSSNIFFATAADLATIGVLYSGSGYLSSVGARTLLNVAMWEVYNKDLAPGMPYNIVRCDVASSPEGTLNCFQQITTQHNISAIIAPENDLPVVIAELAGDAGIPLIASVSGLQELFVCDTAMLPPCVKPYGPRYKSLIGNGVTAATAAVGLVSFLKSFKAGTIAVVTASDVFNAEICRSVVLEAKNILVDVLADITLPADPFGNLTAQSSLDAVLSIRALDPDVVLWCGTPFCREIGEAFWTAEYFPRALGLSQCLDQEYGLSTRGKEVFRYAIGGTTWDERARGNDYSDDGSKPYCSNFAPVPGEIITSGELYSNAFKNFTGGSDQATFTDAGIYAGMYIAQAAIVVANSAKPADVLAAVSLLNIPSFKGRLQVDSNRMVNWGGSLYTQLAKDGVIEVIYPSSSITADLIYPAPTYQERIYAHVPFENMCEKLVVALAVVLSVYVVWGVARPIVIHRDDEDIRVVNWQLSLASLLGVVLSNMSVLTWTVHNTQAQCHGRLWAWAYGFTLMVSPLLGVFARIHWISSNNKMQPRVQTWWRSPIAQVVCQLALCTVILIAWTVKAPFTLTPIVTDVLRPSTNVNECQTNGWLPYGIPLISCFFIAMGALTWLTLRIRTAVRNPRFDRALAVLNASFAWIVLIGVLVLFQYASNTNVPATWMFSVRSVLLLSSNLFYTALMYWAPISRAKETASKRVLPQFTLKKVASSTDEDTSASASSSSPQVPVAIVIREAGSTYPMPRIVEASADHCASSSANEA